MEPGPALVELAATTNLLSTIALIGSGISLALFFGGAGERWGPVNDVLSAVTLILLVPAILACWWVVDGWAVSGFGVASLAALVGVAIAGGGQLALVAGLIDLRSSFVTGGVGILPLLAWAVALIIAGLTGHFPSAPATALLALSLILAAALAAAAAVHAPAVVLGTVAVALLAGLSSWLVVLGSDLSAYG